MSDLAAIYFEENLLTGTLPPGIFEKLSNLQVLHLDENQISGTLDFMTVRNSRLYDLVLHENWFTGTIPGDIGFANLAVVGQQIGKGLDRQAVFGQFYLAILVASLVGGYIAKRLAK